MNERIEAYNEKEKKRDKREWFRTAWLASQIVSYMTGKEIEISDLLPAMFPPKVWTKKEVKAELAKIKKELKIK